LRLDGRVKSGHDCQLYAHPGEICGRPGWTFPFIARLTRAHLNFEVKDGTKCRRQSKSDLSDFDIVNADLGKSRDRMRSQILEFRVQIRFFGRRAMNGFFRAPCAPERASSP
jgi:hypothetical protein